MFACPVCLYCRNDSLNMVHESRHQPERGVHFRTSLQHFADHASSRCHGKGHPIGLCIWVPSRLAGTVTYTNQTAARKPATRRPMAPSAPHTRPRVPQPDMLGPIARPADRTFLCWITKGGGGGYCQHGPWASTVVSRQLPTIATSLPDATHGAVMIAALPPVLSPTLASAHVRAFGSDLRCSPHPHQ